MLRLRRTIDYPFTVVELHMNSDGLGEGKMSMAAKIAGKQGHSHDRPRELHNAAGDAERRATRKGVVMPHARFAGAQ
jgi:hypothetical protein